MVVMGAAQTQAGVAAFTANDEVLYVLDKFPAGGFSGVVNRGRNGRHAMPGMIDR